MCILWLIQAGRSLPPRLVAASKGQPAELVQEAHSCGVRHFGENYVSERVTSVVHFTRTFVAGTRVAK